MTTPPTQDQAEGVAEHLQLADRYLEGARAAIGIAHVAKELGSPRATDEIGKAVDRAHRNMGRFSKVMAAVDPLRTTPAAAKAPTKKARTKKSS